MFIVLPSYEDNLFQTNLASSIVYIHILVSNCSKSSDGKKLIFFNEEILCYKIVTVEYTHIDILIFFKLNLGFLFYK